MKYLNHPMLKLCITASLLMTANTYAGNGPRYSGGEHQFMGDQVLIQLSATETPSDHATFTMTNGATLSYGELLALGDFYGMVNAPISQGKTAEERDARFKKVFDQIDVDPAAVTEAPKLTAVLHNELQYVQTAISKGMSAKAAYAKISTNSDREFNCITGGGCSGSTWWLKMGRATALAASNYDHFGDSAWLAYEAGHRVAMHEALVAHQTQDVARLQRAYAMNALANHFLSDRFAAGHIRGPRVQISEHVTPSDIGNVLMKYMHDEDGDGLNVHNAAGQRWRAYGDEYYFEPVMETHRKHLTAALQLSADEIFTAYQSGVQSDNAAMLATIPQPDATGDQCGEDIAAMFRWDDKSKKLLRRIDLDNARVCSWTTNWFGWSTALKLASIKGLPISLQGQIAKSEYANEAMRTGLITDANIVNYIKMRK
jgi:hypothetical protein